MGSEMCIRDRDSLEDAHGLLGRVSLQEMLDSLVGLAARSKRVVVGRSHNSGTSVVTNDCSFGHNMSNVSDSVHNLSRVFD